MTDSACRIVYYIMYAVELFFVGEAAFHNRVKEKIQYVVMIAVYVAVIIPTVLFMDDYFLIELGLNAAIYLFLFQGKITLRLVHFLGVYLFTSAIEGMVSAIGIFGLMMLLKSFHVSAVRSEMVRLLLAIVSAVCTLYIIRKKWAQKLIGYLCALKWYQYIAVILLTLSGILLLVISEVLLEYIDNSSKIGILLFVTVLILLGATFVGIFGFAFSIYSRNYYVRQNQLKEEIIYSQQKYYRKIYESDRELRKFRHDIRSKLGCLQLLLADGNTKQALEYLEKIGNHFEKLTLQEFHTGSEILDVIIGHKYLESKKKGIRIIVEGKMSTTDFIDIYDLCVLFSNALDNSIEACERLQDREKVITVSIVLHRKVMFFQFMNPATPEMYEILRQGRTSKKDSQKHGFGVENMRTIVNRNGGEMKYIWKDEMLILEIYFEL